MKKLKGLICMLLISLTFFGCDKKTPATYEQISQAEAYEIMKTEKDYIILDVRTPEEFNEGHIPNAICIDYEEVGARAEKELPDKDKLILVYCRSGRRSKIAAQTLCEMGYTHIKEFGGIIDWKYETTK